MKKLLAAVLALATVTPALGADGYLAAQKAYLAENLKKLDWKATPDGLQYHVLKSSSADAKKPAPGATVTINYEGKDIDGKIFDSSYQRNEPATFPLGNLIKGWQEGVPMMRVGETWEFVIPSDLAYGPDGRPPVIMGGATLLFKIELLAVK